MCQGRDPKLQSTGPDPCMISRPSWNSPTCLPTSSPSPLAFFSLYLLSGYASSRPASQLPSPLSLQDTGTGGSICGGHPSPHLTRPPCSYCSLFRPYLREVFLSPSTVNGATHPLTWSQSSERLDLRAQVMVINTNRICVSVRSMVESLNKL